MGKHITEEARRVALSHGADLVGVVKVPDLPEHAESISRILPQADSVMVVASKHSLAALRSGVNQMAQLDTAYTYSEVARAALRTARFLEGQGVLSVALPAFLPLDMQDPKKGMRGEICLRLAGVRSGLGSYGENGLLVTEEFGSAIRLSAVVTEANLQPDQPLDGDACDHCMRCVEACPATALSGGGKINKKLCGDRIFKFGFRFFKEFVEGLAGSPGPNLDEIIHGYPLRELWQTLVTGSYYYCFACQSQCRPQKKRAPDA